MAAEAGETAEQTGTFHCARCAEKVPVQNGHKIPKCPNGHSTFDSRTDEAG